MSISLTNWQHSTVRAYPKYCYLMKAVTFPVLYDDCMKASFARRLPLLHRK